MGLGRFAPTQHKAPKIMRHIAALLIATVLLAGCATTTSTNKRPQLTATASFTYQARPLWAHFEPYPSGSSNRGNAIAALEINGRVHLLSFVTQSGSTPPNITDVPVELMVLLNAAREAGEQVTIETSEDLTRPDWNLPNPPPSSFAPRTTLSARNVTSIRLFGFNYRTTK